MPVTTRSASRKKRKSPSPIKFSNLPLNFMRNVASKLPEKNVAMMYMASPKRFRYAIQPNMNKAKKIGTLKSKIGFRHGSVNTRSVNPAYIRIVRRLQELSPTNNNIGWHSRRIQNFMNTLARLELQGPGMYWNRRHNKEYEFTKGNLIAVPNNPRAPYMTVGRQVSVRPNGTLYFNLRKRRERQRRSN